jgi:hypothetical protein
MSCANKPDAKGNAYPHLCFVVEESGISRFFLLLQKGVMVKAHVGCSVKSFLSEEIGVSPDTMETIQSIFLEGSPVDDLDSAIIKDGSTLALSAAMPGLVGATLRRGGTYASFRSTITHRETGTRCVSGEGLVQMKLFNLMMAALGSGLLKKGVFVRSSDLTEFLSGQSRDFWQGCREVLFNGKPVETMSLEEDLARQPYGDWVFLSVTVVEGDA